MIGSVNNTTKKTVLEDGEIMLVTTVVTPKNQQAGTSKKLLDFSETNDNPFTVSKKGYGEIDESEPHYEFQQNQ